MSATPPRPSADDFLRIGPRVRALPIIHGSGDFAIRVREELLARPYDCVAVPLPPSFQDDVEAAIERLPAISVVIQRDVDGGGGDDGGSGFSYVPIDPCQGVVAAIGSALGERMARAFIDMETPRFEAHAASFPDPYALKRVSPEGFAARGPAGDPPAPSRPARREDRLDGRRAPSAGASISEHPARLLAAGLALDPRRLRAAARRGRARLVLRADPDLRGRPHDLILRSASCRS
jgi:hypothetical protein